MLRDTVTLLTALLKSSTVEVEVKTGAGDETSPAVTTTQIYALKRERN